MKDKVVLITGASSGIGRATAILFASKGAKVCAVGRSEKELFALRDEARQFGATIKPVLADLTQSMQIERVVSELTDANGSLDVLVNSAGILRSGSIETTTIDDWDRQMDMNVRTVFRMMKTCVSHLKKTKGNIVNVSSVAGVRAFPNVLAYCVSKAAVDQLTRCAALELAADGIRVNAVNPGVVVTNLHRRGGMDEEAYSDFLEHSETTHPLGRVGHPEEIADLIYFLASENASWITGVTYAIDGGRAQTCAR
jgi:NAD(P)-dependent dehydrogenase (short-subunit alcohol dehydrogenase family)